MDKKDRKTLKNSSLTKFIYKGFFMPKLITTFLTACVGLINFSAHSQDSYPSRPVSVIVPFQAGHGVDLMARALASEFSKITGQAFPIINREGAVGTIGFVALAAAKPDGYTVAISPNTPLTILPHILKSVAYTYDSFVPVCQSFENVMALFVGPASPYKTYQELVAAAKSQPGKFSWGTTGVGSVPHLSASAWLATAGVDAVHVPFRGEPQLLPQLISNEITFASASISGMAGKGVRPLAVFAEQRHFAYPDVPTMAELGHAAGVPGLNGMFAPRGTPESVLASLEKTCAEVTSSEGFRASAARLNQRVSFLGRRDFDKRLRADFDEKARLVKQLNIKAE
jgi:tripartite-type tricarboxylate transporter receptor subunit TctC